VQFSRFTFAVSYVEWMRLCITVSEKDCWSQWRRVSALSWTRPSKGLSTWNEYVNPFKPSDVKWLHFRVFRAILV